MKKDKAYKALLDTYKSVYLLLGVNFDEIDKVDGWFFNYEMPHSEQQAVLDLMATKHKLTKLEKRTVENSYWLGCSPKDKNESS